MTTRGSQNGNSGAATAKNRVTGERLNANYRFTLA